MTDREAGKRWVETQLRELAPPLGIVVQAIEWLPPGSDGFKRKYLIVSVRTRKGQDQAQINIKDLEDHGSPKVAQKLRYELRMLLARLT
jgi:hypothetical protein